MVSIFIYRGIIEKAFKFLAHIIKQRNVHLMIQKKESTLSNIAGLNNTVFYNSVFKAVSIKIAPRKKYVIIIH